MTYDISSLGSKISLTRNFVLKCMHQSRKGSNHLFVLGISVLSLREQSFICVRDIGFVSKGAIIYLCIRDIGFVSKGAIIYLC
jgi:hypothetical protein